MGWVLGAAIGIVFGVTVGFAAERLPIPAVARSLLATFVAMALGAVATAVALAMLPSRRGLAYYGFGTENLLPIAVLGVIVVGVHLLLGQLVSIAPALANRRVVILACLGGLCGALSVAWLDRIITLLPSAG